MPDVSTSTHVVNLKRQPLTFTSYCPYIPRPNTDAAGLYVIPARVLSVVASFRSAAAIFPSRTPGLTRRNAGAAPRGDDATPRKDFQQLRGNKVAVDEAVFGGYSG